jgi:predicted membrane metal-binding protein
VKVWLTISFLTVAFLSAYNLWRAAERVPPPPRMVPAVPANVVLRHEQRFAKVSSALRTHRVDGVIGYVGDLPPDEMRADHFSMEQYFLSQFVLAPWILDANTERALWAVANLHRTAVAQRIPSGFTVVEDLGAGVSLLKRTSP